MEKHNCRQFDELDEVLKMVLCQLTLQLSERIFLRKIPNHRIIESFKLEKIIKIMKFNHLPSTTSPLLNYI